MTSAGVQIEEAEPLAPIDALEIWCAGVTDRRSRDALVEMTPGYEVAIAIEGLGVLRNPVGHAT